MSPTSDRTAATRRGALPRPVVAVATRATYAAFTGSGFAFASWASRIPQVRDRLGLDPAQLGLLLFSVAAGSVVSLPLAGPAVTRIGSRRAVTAMSVLLAAGLAVISLGYLGGVVPVAVGLFVLGFANGAWDVSMNVQGAVVERHLGRSIMSRFHAGYSVGTVAGALVGAAMVALGVPVTAHLLAVAVLVGVLVPWQVRGFVSDQLADDTGDSEQSTAPRGALAAWREPRTLLIGVSVLAFAFAEGTGNDWMSVAVIDGYGAPPALGTLVFAVFLAAMTAGRWVGPGLLDRFGRAPVIRALCGVAVVGLLLFVLGPTTLTAAIGAVLWGAGVSLGFPVGMSAGADEPRHAASRVGVIASIGYLAFLGGPPLVGFLGDHEGVLRGLLVVAVLMGVAALTAGANRPPARPGTGRA